MKQKNNKSLVKDVEKKKKDKIRSFSTGAVRGTNINKEDYIECVSWLAMKRYAEYMTRKAAVYGRGNWRRGIPIESYMESFMRHAQKFIVEWQHGICEEKDDHLSAIIFNIFGIMHELELYKYKKSKINISKSYKNLYFK